MNYNNRVLHLIPCSRALHQSHLAISVGLCVGLIPENYPTTWGFTRSHTDVLIASFLIRPRHTGVDFRQGDWTPNTLRRGQ